MAQRFFIFCMLEISDLVSFLNYVSVMTMHKNKDVDFIISKFWKNYSIITEFSCFFLDCFLKKSYNIMMNYGKETLLQGKEKKLWKAGRLPLGLITFYNLTVPLDRKWHVVGLGHNPGVGRKEIEKAAVIQSDGDLKPWLLIGINEYRRYWQKFVNYDHPYLQKCKIYPY